MAIFGERMRPTLRDFLRIVFTHKKLITLFFLVITLGVFAYSLVMQPVYEASSKVLARQSRDQDRLTTERVDPQTWRLAFLQTQVQLIKSDRVAKLTLQKYYKGRAGRGAWKSFQDKIFVSSPRGFDFTTSDVLIVSVRDNNPVRAARLANILTGVYIDTAASIRGSDSGRTVRFMQKQADKLRRELQMMDARIKAYERTIGPDLSFLIASVNVKGNPQLQEYSSNYLRARTLLAEVETYIRASRAKLKSGVIPYKMLANNPALLKIKDNLIILEAQLNKLRAQYTDSYPQTKIIQREIQAGRRQLMTAVSRDLAARAIDLEALKARTKALKQIVAHFTRIAQHQLEYSRLLKEYTLIEDAYQNLIKGIQRLSVDAAKNAAKLIQIAVIDSAIPPKKPVRPKVILYTIIAALFALLLGLGLSFWLDFLDHTFKTVEEVEFYLDLPVLGTIPKTGV